MARRTLISQPDIERALKACKRAGYEKARVHINVAAQTIDIMLGEDGASTVGNDYDQWKAQDEKDAMLERVRTRLADADNEAPKGTPKRTKRTGHQ